MRKPFMTVDKEGPLADRLQLDKKAGWFRFVSSS